MIYRLNLFGVSGRFCCVPPSLTCFPSADRMSLGYAVSGSRVTFTSTQGGNTSPFHNHKHNNLNYKLICILICPEYEYVWVSTIFVTILTQTFLIGLVFRVLYVHVLHFIQILFHKPNKQTNEQTIEAVTCLGTSKHTCMLFNGFHVVWFWGWKWLKLSTQMIFICTALFIWQAQTQYA